MASSDLIQINDIALTVPLRLRGSSLPRLERVYLTLALQLDINECAILDDISSTVNYASVTNAVTVFLEDQENEHSYSLHQLVLVLQVVAWESCSGFAVHSIRITLRVPRPTFGARSLSLECTRKASSDMIAFIYSLGGLETSAVVGINPIERKYRQPVRVHADISYSSPLTVAQTVDGLDIDALGSSLVETLSLADYLTLEAFVTRAAQELLSLLAASIVNLPVNTPVAATIRASKPLALLNAESPEVIITRGFRDFPSLFRHRSSSDPWVYIGNNSAPDCSYLLNDPQVITDEGVHTVALAIGSNLGDSCHNIELALRLLEDPSPVFADSSVTPTPQVTITDTSFMYQTAPMYVTDQPIFFNCACVIETNIRPLALLRLLKSIEGTVGRVPSIRNGPRALDLDILYYDDVQLDSRAPAERVGLDNLHGELVVPHPRIHEREFVLRPLCDVIPDFVHPRLNKTNRALFYELSSSDPFMNRVVPFPVYPPSEPPSPPSPPVTSSHWTYPVSQPTTSKHSLKTHVMATLNVTPDSFSDGSDHTERAAAMAYIESSVSAGASIVDVGGYSTRPGASFVSTEDEIARVVPAILAIRQHASPSVRTILISVDTFRPEVAKAAILAGANCINDVYAFTGPDSYPYGGPNDCMASMKQVARELVVPVVLMHSRGEAGRNKDYSEFSYACGEGGEVVEGVKVELGRKVDDIVKGKGGLRRWMVIIDPGIGFSKTLEGNLALLRNSSRITTEMTVGDGKLGCKLANPLVGYPILIGASRKSFLGVVLAQSDSGRETSPKERGWATAAAVACAVQQGSLVVRVHDTREMCDVVAVASSIWTQN